MKYYECKLEEHCMHYIRSIRAGCLPEHSDQELREENLLKVGILLSAKHRGSYNPLSRHGQLSSSGPACVFLFTDIPYHASCLDPKKTEYVVRIQS